ncbi:winged helix-turn-helix transcriptional regulator [Candidatus Roizmanbacteria bacterium]|nr:winged helix-turn-helix transcriptional regulator [Candidatus Roizmanbacteria bacterium]
MNVFCCPKSWLHFFKASADIHRQHILLLIKKHKKINASRILKEIKLSQPTLSHHLTILKNAGLIVEEKKGREVFYLINNKTISSCCLGFAKKMTG